MTTEFTHPVSLTIAGSDCSGGAGLQADLKAFLQHGVHGLSAVTSVVAETPLEVRRIDNVDVSLLQGQVRILLETYPVGAIKTGMLPSRASVIAVVELLREVKCPLVVDPVMFASTGTALIDEAAIEVVSSRLLPCATLVTPNIPEAEWLSGQKINNESDMVAAAQAIAEKHQLACLLKGGHLTGQSELLDVLWCDGEAHEYRHPVVRTDGGFHGTGCTLSAAITANLAKGDTVPQAVQNGIDYLQKLMANSVAWQSEGKEVRVLGW